MLFIHSSQAVNGELALGNVSSLYELLASKASFSTQKHSHIPIPIPRESRGLLLYANLLNSYTKIAHHIPPPRKLDIPNAKWIPTMLNMSSTFGVKDVKTFILEYAAVTQSGVDNLSQPFSPYLYHHRLLQSYFFIHPIHSFSSAVNRMTHFYPHITFVL